MGIPGARRLARRDAVRPRDVFRTVAWVQADMADRLRAEVMP